jgi:hypothetical protein
MREYRYGAVQNNQQYRFIYEYIKYYYLNILSSWNILIYYDICSALIILSNNIFYNQSAKSDKNSSGKFVWNLSMYNDLSFLGF